MGKYPALKLWESIGLNSWTTLKANVTETDTIQQYRIQDYRPAGQQGFLLYRTFGRNQRQENKCKTKGWIQHSD